MTSFYQTRSRILSSNWDRSEETGPVMEESQQWLMLGWVERGLVSLGRAGLESWWADGPWVTVRNHRSRCHAPQSRHSPDCPRSSVKATVATNWFLKSRFFKEHPGPIASASFISFTRYHRGPPTEYETVNQKISQPWREKSNYFFISVVQPWYSNTILHH